MITELLEKFEDLFTPHSEEEVEKRVPWWQVNFYYWGDARRLAKSVEVKGPMEMYDSYAAIADEAVYKIGLERNIVQYCSIRGYTVEIRKSDGIEGYDGELMDGEYRMVFQIVDKEE